MRQSRQVMTLVACLAALPAFCAAANPPAARLIYSRPDRQYGAETFSVTALFDRPLVGAEVFISVASPSRRGKTLVEKAPMSASRSGRFFRFARAVAETGADDGTFEITLRVEEDGKEPVDVVPSNDRFAIAASRSAESGDFAARADSARRSAAAGTLALPGEVAIEEQVLVPQAPQAPVYAPYGYYDPQQYYSSGYTPVYGYANSSPFFASTFGYGDYFIPSTRYRHHPPTGRDASRRRPGRLRLSSRCRRPPGWVPSGPRRRPRPGRSAVSWARR
ncbi:MAG: hypothetical protein HY303_12180 [Candidatus Wallbacteria bacterium]|nr:hypothetical protein [Candidatus Wallbacteria bacterium]